jgi:YQGE family putative transporter
MTDKEANMSSSSASTTLLSRASVTATVSPTSTTRLTAASSRLLMTNALYAVGRGLSDLFLSVYLYRLKPDIHTLAIVGIATWISVGVVLPPMGYIVRQYGARRVHVMGALLSAIFYVSILLLGDAAAHYLVTIGMIQGIMTALISLAGHVMVNEVTTSESRDRYLNQMGTVKALVDFGCPLIAGIIASALPGNVGYQLLFMASFCCFVSSAVVCMKLEPPKSTDDDVVVSRQSSSIPRVTSRNGDKMSNGKIKFRLLSTILYDDASWRASLLAYLFIGLQDGLYGTGRTLLMWRATGGERQLGSITSIISLLGAASFAIATRWMNNGNRQISFGIGAMGMAMASLLLAFGGAWSFMMVHCIAVALATPLWSTSTASASLNVITQISSARPGDDISIEMLCAREIPLSFGRVALLTIFLVTTSPTGSTLILHLLLVLSSVSFPAVYLCYHPPSWLRPVTFDRPRSKSV